MVPTVKPSADQAEAQKEWELKNPDLSSVKAALEAEVLWCRGEMARLDQMRLDREKLINETKIIQNSRGEDFRVSPGVFGFCVSIRDTPSDQIESGMHLSDILRNSRGLLEFNWDSGRIEFKDKYKHLGDNTDGMDR